MGMSNQGIWQYQWPLKDFTDSLNTAEGWRDTFWQFKCWFLCSSYKLWPQLVLTFFHLFPNGDLPKQSKTQRAYNKRKKKHRDFCLVLFSFLLTVFLFKSIFECVIWHTDWITTSMHANFILSFLGYRNTLCSSIKLQRYGKIYILGLVN